MMRLLISLSFLICAGLPSGLICRAQVAPSAYARPFSITAGGLASGFQPDYGPNYLYGVGAFVDVKFSRWAQIEGEGRWLRFNQFANIYEDNYLIGPRVPIRRIWKANTYAKVLGGYGIMNFQYNYAHGRFYAIAFGGGAESPGSFAGASIPRDASCCCSALGLRK